MPFTQFGLAPSLLRNVHAVGYVNPTPIQVQAIPVVRSGRDLIATAQTGTGKTAAFMLPVLHDLLERSQRTTGALILTPTRELAQQIFSVCRGLSAGTNLRSTLVVGGAGMEPQERGLRAGSEIVVATPGRLLDLLNRGHGKMVDLRTLVLDEADQMFDLGFFPDLKRIIARLPARRQTLLFSATMPPEVARLGQTILQSPQTVAIGPQGKAAGSVTQTAYLVPTHRKTALLEHLLGQQEMPSVLVFTKTRRGARKLTRALAASGHGVAELHSDCTPAQRARAMHGFRTRTFPVLVATNIAARGLDVHHITHVVNFDVPNVPDEYIHRIGRTGRAERTGDAIVFVSPEEGELLARIERRLGQRIPRQRLTDFDYTVKAPPPAPSVPSRRPRSQASTARPQNKPRQKVGPGHGRRG